MGGRPEDAPDLGGLRQRVEERRTGRVACGTRGISGLDPERLAPLDVGAGTRVLDVGAGLGGPARLLAHRRGCRVTCVDLTPEFCAAARLLTAMTGLSERVDVVEADASRLPFTGGAFDVVWMQNSSMNIPDKARLFGEGRRVLRSGGLLALQEVVLGPAGLPVRFPVPWADVAPLSFLRAPGTLRQTLLDAGLAVQTWADITDWALAQPPPETGQALGVDAYLPDAATKRANSRRNLQEGRCALLRVTATVG
jgi:SAM-dependent methyltransferase